MRSIGAAERALELMVDRLSTRIAFGKPLSAQSIWHERIAESRCMIDQARMLTMNAAHMMDTVGNKGAKQEIAMIKVVAPNVSCKVVDWAIQAYGAAGDWAALELTAGQGGGFDGVMREWWFVDAVK